MRIKGVLLCLMVVFSVAMTSAQDITKVATTSGQFLKLNVSPHAAGLGGAYVAVANDVTALVWNPAGIAFFGKTAIGVYYTKLYAGIRNMYLGFSRPIDRSSAFGFSVIYLNSGEMEITTVELPNGTSEYFDVADMALGLSYARRLTDLFSVGVTVKVVSERIYRETAWTIAFDAGSYFNTGIAATTLGMCISNFGGHLKLDGPDLDDYFYNVETGLTEEGGARLETESWPLPLMFRMGIKTDLFGGQNEKRPSPAHRLTSIIDVNDPLDHRLRFNFGMEYEWNRILSVRAGYQPAVYLYEDINDETGDTKNIYEESRLGFGFGLNLKNGPNSLKVDYAVTNYGILDFVQQAGISIQF